MKEQDRSCLGDLLLSVLQHHPFSVLCTIGQEVIVHEEEDPSVVMRLLQQLLLTYEGTVYQDDIRRVINFLRYYFSDSFHPLVMGVYTAVQDIEQFLEVQNDDDDTYTDGDFQDVFDSGLFEDVDYDDDDEWTPVL